MSETTSLVTFTEKGIRLSGELVFSTVSQVMKEGCLHLENHKADSIIIDLSEVKKIDSAGITLLLAWKRLCDMVNKNFQVNGSQEQATSLITTNKLHKILNLK